ncbi:MAG: hypothetical protein N2170_08465 [Bacteroidia bacterium]|nr:hypothetical protein [Bacteroidia bacterium]
MRRVWVADAGATKTDWAVYDSSRSLSVSIHKLEGLNVEVEGWDTARENLQRAAAHLLEKEGEAAPTEIYYYGPALHSESLQSQMRLLLEEIFSGKSKKSLHIEVYHDLMGAARAAWPTGEGIVAILGTGSNCAFWDGKTVVRQAGGHGYLLGDEGSGADIGRHFLSAFLHGEVPSEIQRDFREGVPIKGVYHVHGLPPSPRELRSVVYRSEHPSRLLASMTYFLVRHLGHPWVDALIRSRFEAFAQRTWSRWPAPRRIRYVGGVAQVFKNLLQEVTQAYGGEWEGDVPQVAETLLRYHVAHGGLVVDS